MTKTVTTQIAEIIARNEREILDKWVQLQLAAITSRPDLIQKDELREDAKRFLQLFGRGLRSGGADVQVPEWKEAREMLAHLSVTRGRKGFSPAETASFVFSLKQPLFQYLRDELAEDPARLADETWSLSMLLDSFGLFTTEVYQKGREEVIARQQQEMLDLSTPVVELWQGILAVPLIGTLDSQRTQVVMENLLQRIVATGSRLAIIDITGVPTVDTLVAQHLLKTVAAARLMGAECVISGIRPQIAQTIVHLGVDLSDVMTKSSLADAFQIALARTGREVVNTSSAG
jgi:rsbT co-antagonist protein RsbR